MTWIIPMLITVAFAQEPVTSQELLDCSIVQIGKLQKQNVLQSEAALSDTRTAFRPSLSLSPGYDHSESEGIVSSGASFALSVQQKIFDAGLNAQIAARAAALRADQYALTQNALKLSSEAVDALMSRQKLVEQLKLVEIRRRNFDELSRAMESANRVGLVDSADYLQSKSAVLDETATAEKIAFDLRRIDQNFQTAFGFQAFEPARLAIAESPRVVSVSRLPGINSLRLKTLEAEATKKQRDHEFWPSLSLGGAVSNAKYVSQFSTAPTTDASVFLTLDLSGLFRDSLAQSSAAAAVQQRENIFRQQLQETQNQYSQMDDELAVLGRQLPNYEQRLELASKAQDVSRAKIRIGRIGFIEFRQIEQTFSLATQDLVACRLRIHLLELQKELASLSIQKGIGSTSCALK